MHLAKLNFALSRRGILMVSHQDVVLAHLEGDSPDQRVELALLTNAEGSNVVLRQQSWAAGLGWFTQTSIVLSPSQVTQLQSALGRKQHALTGLVPAHGAVETQSQDPVIIPFPGPRSGRDKKN